MEIVPLPVKASIPRDGRGKPLVVPPEGGKPIALARMTTYIDAIDDKTNIANWKARMVAYGMATDPNACDEMLKDLVAHEPDTKPWKQAADRHAEYALERAGANRKRDKGTYLHDLSEYMDKNLPLPDGCSEEDVADMAAYAMATLDYDIVKCEEFMVLPELAVGGTPDRVSRFTGVAPDGKVLDNALIITDLKTGTIEYGANKMCAQLAGYSRSRLYDWRLYPVQPAIHQRTGKPLDDPDGKKALDRWKQQVHPARDAYSSIGDIDQDWGVIFNMRPGSAQVDRYWVDLNLGWELLNLATVIRKARSLPDGLHQF